MTRLIALLLLFTTTAFAENEITGTPAVEEVQIYDEWAITSAITVPQPLTIGIQKKLDPFFPISVFLEGGWFKYSFGENKSRSVKDYSIITGVRFNPFYNWLTLTGEFGYRHIGVNVDISNLKMDGVSLANTAQLGVNTFFMGLLVGGQWFISENVALGFDVGLQFAVPFVHGGGVTIKQIPGQEDGSDLSVDDEEVMKRISGIPIPQIALLRAVFYL